MAGDKVLGERDVVLKIGAVKFPCFREVLSQNSPYFQAMFGHNFVEREKSIIEIQNVDPEAMKALLEFMQTNEIPSEMLRFSHLLPLLEASSMLQFESVQKICINIISCQMLTAETCLQTMATAHGLDLLTLYRKARALAFWEFSAVKTTGAFFDLSIEGLEDYLGNDCLNTKQGEFEVFDAGLSWLQEDSEDRKQYILRILQCVRFRDVCSSDIQTMYLYPNVTENVQALNTLQCVLAFKERQPVSGRMGWTQTDLENNENKDESEVSDLNSEQANCCKRQKRCVREELHKESDNNSDPSQSDNCFSKRSCCCLGSSEPSTNCACWSTSSSMESVPYEHSPKSSQSSSIIAASKSAPQNNLEDYDSATISVALQLLNTKSRALPLVPCVIGHKIDKETYKMYGNNVKPYVIYFDDNQRKPVPFLHLAKVSEGPVEPSGYRVINKGQDLFVIGGEYLLGYGNWNITVWKYNIWKEEWMYESSLLSPRRHHSVCIVEDDIYIIGGFGRHRVIMDTVDKYNTISKTWTHCTSLPSSMYSAACCVHKGNIYVFGVELCFYDIERNTWRTFRESPLPPNMTFNSAMSHGDWIYLTGTYSSELLRFSPKMAFGFIPGNESSHQLLGSFKNRPSCTCLVNDKIYSFTTDEQGRMFVELYDIIDGNFKVLWEGAECEVNGIVDFSPKHCIGCFAMALY